ncbi:MAG: AAA family ATPase [Bifidobacteriaceae bacterium]|jgi:hypothetical protein|nr:AAA family ATPase [Bifidobacteriaceae bacterium]
MSGKSTLERLARDQGNYWTGPELAEVEFPPPRWAVPGLIPEGLTFLAGRPKLGKSWLCWDLALGVATGGTVLGRLPVDQPGDVLYLALEDTGRRAQERALAVSDGAPLPDRLTVVNQLPRPEEDEGPCPGETWAEHLIHGWVEAAADPRLVIVDVLAKVKGQKRIGETDYEADYRQMSGLKTVADRHKVAIVLVHHCRKMKDEDAFLEVSGSTGLTSCADTLMVLQRPRREGWGVTTGVTKSDKEVTDQRPIVLNITGRDVEESAWVLDWDGDACRFALTDMPPSVARLSGTKQQVVTYLAAHGPAKPQVIAEVLGIKPNTVTQTCRRLVNERVLDQADGFYLLPLGKSVTSVTLSPSADVGVTK